MITQKPYKNLILQSSNVEGQSYWPEPLSDNDRWWIGGSDPQYYTWRIDFSISFKQYHGYPRSTIPFEYSGLDINKGDFVASGDQGKCFRIIEVISKSENNISCIVEDVYRTITFNSDSAQSSPPSNSSFVCFNVDESFNTNINAYFLGSSIRNATVSFIPYYLKQISFIKNPIFQCNCSFNIGDIVAIEKGVGFTTPQGDLSKNVVGRVIGTTGITNEYIVDPITEHASILETIGEPGDTLYLSDDGTTLTTDITRKPIYLKTLNAIPNIAISSPKSAPPVINSGTVVEINGVDLSFTVDTSMGEFIDTVNSNADLNINASEVYPAYEIKSDRDRLEYGLIGVTQIPTVIDINGTEVTIQTTDAGQEKYGSEVAIGQDIVKDINDAEIPDITARFDSNSSNLYIINESGEDIIITNISGDIFASDTENSSTGFNETNTSPKDVTVVKMIVDNGEEIVIREKSGDFINVTGILGSDNGETAKGIFYGGKMREGTNYVVDDMDQVNNLSPFIGDGVHVIDSGNGEWVEMKFTQNGWVIIATEDSARTDADTLSKNITYNDNGTIYIGTVSNNSRISNITVKVNTPFDDNSTTLNIGDSNENDSLLSDDHVDLLNTGEYTNIPSKVYTEESDLYAYITGNNTVGELKIVISYT